MDQPSPQQGPLELMEFKMDDSSPVTPQAVEGSMSEGLFFADATLDLREAHDIADTPEPEKLVMTAADGVAQTIPIVEMPTLSSKSETGLPTRAKIGPNKKNAMNRIDGGNRSSISEKSPRRPKPPRRPRDVKWMIGFCAFVPLSLLIATWLSEQEDGSPVAISKGAKSMSFYALIFGYGVSLILARMMYRTMGGGDGEDARHVASQVILGFAPISLGVNTAVIICIYLKLQNATVWAVIPMFFLLKDIVAMNQWRTTASTTGGRHAFFQALCCMGLDILSRSLRRSSFYRVVSALLSVQLIVVLWWRAALLGALRNGSFFWLIVTLAAGKWASSTVARVLGLVASGGVTSWFVQQSIAMHEMKRSGKSPDVQDELTGDMSLAEEYKATDASAYQPVLEIDDGIDDDYDEEDEKEGTNGLWSDSSNSTVLSFLRTGLTVSFGSVAQCGLLGGLAQFLWSLLRNVDTTATALSQRFPTSSRFGFRGMQIGREGIDRGGVICKTVGHINLAARSFVRSHTDLALCEVAAYYKSYQRAAIDVTILVDGSGMEPIVHDDITTHMCTCVSGSISGALVVLMGLILDHHRYVRELSDATVVHTALLSFVLCYTIIFTAMEPLRASIKAIYVCFAQHPESLSHTYPLIFHRLSRISEANLV